MKERVTIVRKVLALVLLMLFAPENVALTSVIAERPTAITHQHSLDQPHFQTFYSLLAEGNEERNQKNEIILPVVREVLYSLLIPEFSPVLYPLHVGIPGPTRTLPIYSVHCSFLI